MKFGRILKFCVEDTGIPLKHLLVAIVFSQSVVVANAKQSQGTQTGHQQTSNQITNQKTSSKQALNKQKKSDKTVDYRPQNIEELIYASGGYTSYNSIKQMENASGIGGEDIENILVDTELSNKETKKHEAEINEAINISADKLKPVEISIDPLEKADVLGDLASALTTSNGVKNKNSNVKSSNVKNSNAKSSTNKTIEKTVNEPDSITLLTNETLAKKYKNHSFSQDTQAQPISNQSVSTGNSHSKKIVAHPIRNAKKTSNFGYRRIFGRKQFHKGTDFAAPYGTAIHAAGDGTVSYAGWMRGYGRIVIIDHGDGLKTRYAHNAKLRVKKGQYVRANQHISDMGCSGRCTGPHLHFEVRKNGKAQNPMNYLESVQ